MALDEALTGQITPQQIEAAVQLAPAMPWESPLPFMPRYLARRLWPGGFVPFQQLATLPAQAPAQAAQPPGLPPPPKPRAVAPPPPPPVPVTFVRPVHERRGM